MHRSSCKSQVSLGLGQGSYRDPRLHRQRESAYDIWHPGDVVHDFMGMGGWVGLIANIGTNFTESPRSFIGGKKVQAFREKHWRQILKISGGTSREPHYSWVHPSKLNSPQISRRVNLTAFRLPICHACMCQMVISHFLNWVPQKIRMKRRQSWWSPGPPFSVLTFRRTGKL